MHRLFKILCGLTVVCGLVSPASAEEKGLTVFAAASMKNALDDVDAAFTAKTGINEQVAPWVPHQSSGHRKFAPLE